MTAPVAALFATPEAAEAARLDLIDAGIAPDALRVLPLSRPSTPGATLAEGFARALAELGLGSAPAEARSHTLLIVSGDAPAALPVLEAARPLAIDREAARWADTHGAVQEAAAGLAGGAAGAATGFGATSLTTAASGLTPGRVAAPGPVPDVGAGTEPPERSDALEKAQIAAERNRRD